jgi:hypothetical protein
MPNNFTARTTPITKEHSQNKSAAKAIPQPVQCHKINSTQSEQLYNYSRTTPQPEQLYSQNSSTVPRTQQPTLFHR